MGLGDTLRRIFGLLPAKSDGKTSVATLNREGSLPPQSTLPSTPAPSNADNPAAAYLEEIRGKLERLGEDFAKGRINRAQYEELYEHYQRQKKLFSTLATNLPDAESARQAMVSGGSMIIRRQREAQVISYSIYSNETSLPLFTHGQFQMDPALVIGMLSGFRSASQEMLGSGVRKTEVEDGKVLCFVPGRLTTLVVLYSLEASQRQEARLKVIHQNFEDANSALLSGSYVDSSKLSIPHEDILGTGPSLRELL